MKTYMVVAAALLLGAALVVAQTDTPGDDEHPNESRAVGIMRTLNTAQAYYTNHYPDVGFACTLAQLGEGGAGKPSPEAAGLITKELVSGHVAGYKLAVNCAEDDQKPYARVTMYAVPANPSSGARAFCTEQHRGGSSGPNHYEGGIILYSKDGRAETCFMKGTPLK